VPKVPDSRIVPKIRPGSGSGTMIAFCKVFRPEWRTSHISPRRIETMIRILLTLMAMIFAMPTYAEDTKPATRGDTAKKMPLDDQFLAVASECCSCQCGMIELAEKQASRPEVKEFATKLEQDHKALHKKLAAMMKDRKVDAATEGSKETKARCTKLGKLEGKDFDTAFLKHIVADHEKAIRACENQIENGKDAKVTEFATSAVKKLREHLKEAKKLQA
jgi:putative membrane protein